MGNRPLLSDPAKRAIFEAAEAAGFDNTETARLLGVSAKTVAGYRRRLGDGTLVLDAPDDAEAEGGAAEAEDADRPAPPVETAAAVREFAAVVRKSAAGQTGEQSANGFLGIAEGLVADTLAAGGSMTAALARELRVLFAAALECVEAEPEVNPKLARLMALKDQQR